LFLFRGSRTQDQVASFHYWPARRSARAVRFCREDVGLVGVAVVLAWPPVLAASCCRGRRTVRLSRWLRFEALCAALQRRSRGGQFRSPRLILLTTSGSIGARPSKPLAFTWTGIASASHEVLSPSAPAGRAALSGAAGLRTIPLRLWPVMDGLAGSVIQPSRPACPCGVSHCIHPGHRRTPADRCRSPRVMHRGPLIPRCSATRCSASFTRLRRSLSRPGNAHGVSGPSQLCSRMPGFGMFPSRFPHMPSSGLPPRRLSVEGPAA